jgi:hypothetical protein
MGLVSFCLKPSMTSLRILLPISPFRAGFFAQAHLEPEVEDRNSRLSLG